MRSLTVIVLLVLIVAVTYANDVQAETQNDEDPHHLQEADA